MCVLAWFNRMAPSPLPAGAADLRAAVLAYETPPVMWQAQAGAIMEAQWRDALDQLQRDPHARLQR